MGEDGQVVEGSFVQPDNNVRIRVGPGEDWINLGCDPPGLLIGVLETLGRLAGPDQLSPAIEQALARIKESKS